MDQNGNSPPAYTGGGLAMASSPVEGFSFQGDKIFNADGQEVSPPVLGAPLGPPATYKACPACGVKGIERFIRQDGCYRCSPVGSQRTLCPQPLQVESWGPLMFMAVSFLLAAVCAGYLLSVFLK